MFDGQNFIRRDRVSHADGLSERIDGIDGIGSPVDTDDSRILIQSGNFGSADRRLSKTSALIVSICWVAHREEGPIAGNPSHRRPY